jgi:hypothetical protein
VINKSHYLFLFCKCSTQRAVLCITAIFISTQLFRLWPYLWEGQGSPQVTHLPPMRDLLPWNRHPSTRDHHGLAIKVKWLAQGPKWGGQWQVLNPLCSDHEDDTITWPCCPSGSRWNYIRNEMLRSLEFESAFWEHCNWKETALKYHQWISSMNIINEYHQSSKQKLFLNQRQGIPEPKARYSWTKGKVLFKQSYDESLGSYDKFPTAEMKK